MNHLKQRIFTVVLLVLATFPTISLQAGDSKNKLPQKPYFAMPWTEAFGMRMWQLKECPEIYKGAKSEDYNGSISIEFAYEKKFVKEIEYRPKYSAIECDYIMSHTYALFPSKAETEGFLFEEIPAEWVKISKEDYKEGTGYDAHIAQPIDQRTPYEVKAQCYRLPQVEGKPTVYACACATIEPQKKGQYSAQGTIVFLPQKKMKR